MRQVQCKFIRFPEKYRSRMEEADAQVLPRRGERILTTQTVEEVFENSRAHG